MEDCPICYEPMLDVNICVTICNHKFHINCLMKSGNICPLCRKNVSSTSYTPSLIKEGMYTMDEYIEQLNKNNISIDDIPLDIKLWIDECKETVEMMKIKEEINKQKNEKYKINLKKTDINKYDLFYGKK
jgi:hypothetical protein